MSIPRLSWSLACVVLVGCARNDTDPLSRASTTTLTSATMPTRAEPEPDPVITRRVEATLARDPRTSSVAANVEVPVTEGIVTLSGAVADFADKRLIERTARETPGVVETLDKVDISPSRAEDVGEIDERIAFSLQRAMMADPALAGDTSRVSVDVSRGGRVVLRGTTDHAATRASLERVARGIQGVTRVESHVVVESAP